MIIDAHRPQEYNISTQKKERVFLQSKAVKFTISYYLYTLNFTWSNYISNFTSSKCSKCHQCKAHYTTHSLVYPEVINHASRHSPNGQNHLVLGHNLCYMLYELSKINQISVSNTWTLGCKKCVRYFPSETSSITIVIK